MHRDAYMPDPITPTMTRMNRRHSYKRERDVESGCIYRRLEEPEHEGPLTDEHIIAQSVGGMLVLEKASCPACANQTHAFEGHAFDPLRPLRQQLGFPMSRETKNRIRTKGEDKFIVKADGKKIKVPMSTFPALAIHLAFPMAGILINQPMDDRALGGSIHGIELTPGFGERFDRLRAKLRAREIAIVGVDAAEQRRNQNDYGRMLAKVGHSYAVAKLGLGNFCPLLLDIIHNKSPLNLSHYIGSSIGKPDQPTDLHEIGFAPRGMIGGDELVIVKVRLFANLQGQTHYIVVGEWL
jgi:hypothetical protein